MTEAEKNHLKEAERLLREALDAKKVKESAYLSGTLNMILGNIKAAFLIDEGQKAARILVDEGQKAARKWIKDGSWSRLIYY